MDSVVAERKARFKQGGSVTPAEAQARRRHAALEAQKERRQHAFMIARSLVGELDSVSELSLESDSSSSDEDEQFQDAPPADAPVEPVVSAAQRAKHKKKQRKIAVKPWAKGLLSFAETLDLGMGLPERLESDWSAVVVPEGKRCLCITTGSSTSPNTILVSRVSGRTLYRRTTQVPGDTLLDCIFDKSLDVLWVLDIVKWRGVWYVEHEHAFRSFFLASKLSELDAQHYVPPPPLETADPTLDVQPNAQTGPVLVLPAPSVNAPLTRESLLTLLAQLSSPARLTETVMTTLYPTPTTTQVEIPIKSTGLLLYVSRAQYESGDTALVGWIPNQVEQGKEDSQGMDKFARLVHDWHEPSPSGTSNMEI